MNIAQLQFFTPQITKMSQFWAVKTRPALTPYYSFRAHKNMLYESFNILESPDINQKAKVHCFRHCNLHISSFSVLILSFTHFHQIWSSGSTLNHVLGGLEPSWMPGRSFGMTLELPWKLHFFMIFHEKLPKKLIIELSFVTSNIHRFEHLALHSGVK